MKIREFFYFNNSENKYDVAIRMCYIMFFAIGFIVLFSIGLEHMKFWVWLLTFICCVIGAIAYGTIAKSTINMVRNIRQGGGKVEAEQILKL